MKNLEIINKSRTFLRGIKPHRKDLSNAYLSSQQVMEYSGKVRDKVKAKINKDLFEKAIKNILKKRKRKVCLVLVDNYEIKKLNRQYRKKDKVANVLSFPAVFENQEKIILPKKEKIYLGEIVISVPQAKKQANFFGYSLNKELIRLFIHGLLHLLGYEHEKKKEQILMEKIEKKIIKSLKL
ncbi:MAG: rRNA maturation RNase YbeY [Patescibacteria group bacterium]